jgi:hypothetical protein
MPSAQEDKSMKTRNHMLAILAAMALTTACVIDTNALLGNPNGAMTPEAFAGLDALTHFRADLTVTMDAQMESGAFHQTKHYSLSAWPTEKAVFETMDTVDENNQILTITLGTVGEAGYLLVGEETGCDVTWAADNIHIDINDLSRFLLPIYSSMPAGDETVAGVAAHAFILDSNSIGLEGVQATGKEWLAASGNYVVKYHLELSGGEALFGPGATGTSTIDYALSEVNDGSAVKYPGDCLPVLTNVPATQDAQDVLRMPGSLSFTSAMSPADIQQFYRQYFDDQGWKLISDLGFPDGETDTSYVDPSTGDSAIVSVRSSGNTVHVKVDVFTAKSSAAETPTASAAEDASMRISLALSKALGNTKTPSVYPSYSLSVEEILPTTSGSYRLSLTAEAEGANLHYLLTENGKTTEVLLFGGEVYSIINGKAQPGSETTDLGWTTWQMDPTIILSTAALANPQRQTSETLESRIADKYAIDSSSLTAGLPDFGMGILPYTITKLQGTIWIDHETGGLLRVDLTFEADVLKPGDTTTTAHGMGELHILFHQIGATTVSPPS